MSKKQAPAYLKYLLALLFLSMVFAGFVFYHVWKAHGVKGPPAYYISAFEQDVRESIDSEITLQEVVAPVIQQGYGRPNIFGDYLIGRFAQLHHDWSEANTVMQKVLEQHPGNIQLMKRGMILAMGSGDHETALRYAHEIYAQKPDSPLVLLMLISEAFNEENYEQAERYIKDLPPGSVSDFILPLLQSWVSAAQGEMNLKDLSDYSIHMYHAILIADYLGKDEAIADLLEKAEGAHDLSLYDLERLADLYAHIGMNEKALHFYEQINALHPQPLVQEKIAVLENGGALESRFESVDKPQHGIANAFYDMARALLDEYSDESARVFGHVALYLDPDYTNAKLLLAHITARNGRYDEAIGYYQSINPDDAGFLDAQRKAADLYEETGHYDQAVEELRGLIETYDDVEAMIQLGDLYRRAEEFAKAVAEYNRAQEALGGEIDADHWHIHYMRGMAYERNKQWEKAEKDLKAALEFRPDHPFVLNYLGYAWADQGIHLEEAQEMLHKAVRLQPHDGSITDSLGWVMFKLGEYEEAIKYLERAVELLPYDPVINDHLGDAYWHAGRKMEARFQWERAVNYGDEETDIEAIREKLERGSPVLVDRDDKSGENG